MTISPASQLNSPAPRYATQRNPDLATFGPAVGQVLTFMGLPPMPWQQQVLDVSCEVNDDGTWRWPTVVLTVPRQAGKTALIGGLMIHRLLSQPGSRLYYTAQTGLAAVEAYTEWVGMTMRAMPDKLTYRRSAGQQSIRLDSMNSSLRIFPPTADSLHGRQTDLVVMDECFAHTQDQGDLLLQAVIPTQATRPMRQTWLVSTAGGVESLWWRQWVDKGRESLNDPTGGIAFFEWSADPGLDITDPASWPTFHPAYAQTQAPETFKIALEQLGPDGFDRAYGNRWPDQVSSWRESWPECADSPGIPGDAQVVFGFDSPPNNDRASIVAAAPLPDGRVAVEVVEHKTGTDWVVARAVELQRAHGAKLCIARNGPLAFCIPDIVKHGVPVEQVTPLEVGDAIGRFQAAVTSRHVTHPSDPRMDAAVANIIDATSERPMWQRRAQKIEISPVVAAALAVWGVEAAPSLPQVF